MAALQVTDLYLYPVKSFAGIQVEQIRVNGWGPEGDRRFMVIDAAGKFVTGRKFPQMVLFKVERQAADLVIKAPDDDQFVITFPQRSEMTEVQVWSDQVQAKLVDSAVSVWLSQKLQDDVRLVYMPDSTFRQVDPKYYSEEQRVAFSDAYPFLITNKASLGELNARLEEPVSIRRFRPNIVVDGNIPWEEDNWSRLRIGSVEFAAVKPCSRCVFTTVDPETAEKGKEPLRTLAQYRRMELGVIFGQNLVQLNTGVISVGDVVEVVWS